jgi:hypothetical protein
VIWRDVDLDLGVLRVTSTLIRVTGRGWVRKRTKSQAGERVLLLPEWGVILLEKRRAVAVCAEEPVFGTVGGTFRDSRTGKPRVRQAAVAAGSDHSTR